MTYRYAASSCLALSLCAVPASATQSSPNAGNREIVEDIYVREFAEANALYESAPVTHVVPSLKTITFALAAKHYDVTVTDREFRGSGDGRGEHQLTVEGYSLAPYLAVSLARVGLGFGVEAGARAIEYGRYDRFQPRATTGYTLRQRSELEYTAVGAYLYLLPYESRGERAIIASMVAGAKDYNVKAKVSPVTSSAEPLRGQRFRYNVTEYELGFLVELKLLKKFSVVPWVDYTYLNIHDAVSQADDIIANQNASWEARSAAAALKGDAHVVWRARPRVDIGLDLVVKVGGFRVHLGEAFGYVVGRQHGDGVEDRSYYLSASFDMKGT